LVAIPNDWSEFNAQCGRQPPDLGASAWWNVKVEHVHLAGRFADERPVHELDDAASLHAGAECRRAFRGSLDTFEQQPVVQRQLHETNQVTLRT
jgi:hypothetical protein